MHLLYIVFGENTSNHLQASFSIYSFLAQNVRVKTINVITDNSSLYSHLKPAVNIIELTNDVAKEWRGEVDFFWRIKIKGIQYLCNLYPNEPVVYLDGDTFCYKNNATHLKDMLNNGKAIMHLNEGPLSQAKSKTEKLMWKQVGNNNYGGVNISSQSCMWNAGVVATPNTVNGKDIETALNICDEMCSTGVTRRLVEQFALSIALNHTYDLQPITNEIAHYWSNKPEWSNAISLFFLECYFTQKTQAEIIEKIKQFPFNSIAIVKKQRSTNERLKKTIDKLFSPRSTEYLNL